jgi:hypothetical protein
MEVRESEAGLLVELWGEFDVFCIGELKRMLTDISSQRGPIQVDLSRISFLDLQSARQIAVHSLFHAHHLTFLDPSSQVMATLRALRLEGWLENPPGTGHGEPQVFSGVL